MDLNPDNKLLQDIKPKSLVEYLELNGWKLSTSNNKWRVFKGANDYYGNPLEIVLPQNLSSPDARLYISNTINMLSSLKQIEPELLIHNINYYERDILRIRNIETRNASSISLSLASQQVPQLKNLISYSACSEIDPIPSHTNAKKPLAKQMVKHYQFGHTFRGSFGYTVESPISENLLSDNEMVGRTRFLPIERRVMERIVRGLSYVKQATETRNSNIIIDNYGKGLNANMCLSLLNLSPDQNSPIEFSITWSPKIAPSKDISDQESFVFNESSYIQLEYAATILDKLEPKEITIRGLVKELKTDDNPIGLDTSRAVVINITNENDTLPSKVTVLLNAEDYQAAISAHKEWLPVIITGILQRGHGNKWHINKYSSFNVTPRLL